ncbi:hypothetical protein DSM104299_00132 [Baekduia alba]|uniref:hypothetical protein n=1 Tax=Baekduia alba TaxID=2997333 RepID=UPI002342711D|nr:hypothetical protein [Baekduia alba]WCB91461.1 hypothetical protein DSM104299_00132 [Baekduia alba]
MTIGRFRHLLPAIVVVALALGAGPARAADTTIGFEDQPDGTAVGAQYSALGVQLDPSSALAVEADALAHGGAKLLRATDHACAPGTSVAFTGVLSSPRTTIGIWVHDPYAMDPSAREVTLQGYDDQGRDAGHTSLSITSALGWQRLLLVADPGRTVDHFAVTVESGICTMLFDDLSFNAAAGAEPPSVGWEDVATQPVSVERGATATTTATLRRRGGSTGRVSLTVTGLPSGVTATVAPAQANGADLRSTATITLTAAATAPATASPVAVTLRATPVDGTAGPATAVQATFPLTVEPPSVSLALTAPAPTDLYRYDTATLSAQLVRHSLSSGRVALTATGPAGVTVTVSPAVVDGAAPTTPITVAVAVAGTAPRDPLGAIRIVATSTDAAAAPPGREAELRVAAPIRIPALAMSVTRPSKLLLRAGAGTSRVDADITPIDIPPGAVIRSGVQFVPKDVELDVNPTAWSSAGGAVLLKANLTARTGTTSASVQTAKLFAAVDIPGHGTINASAFFQLTVVPTIRYALAARGIEVTQGTQTLGPNDCDSIPTRDIGHIDSSVPYQGVRLVDGDLTVARVYVSAWLLTNTDRLPNVGVRLHAYRGGKELAGSPMSPAAAPTAVGVGELNCVTARDRSGSDNVYTYILPPAWTYGTVTLQAEILPIPPTATGAVLDECGSLFCQTFKRFTLRSIGFTRLRWPGIMPLRVTAKGQYPGSADSDFYSARMLHPGDPYVWSYQGDIDISGLVDLADAAATIPDFLGLTRREIVEAGTAGLVRNWAMNLPGRSIVAGLAPNIDGIAGVSTGSIATIPAHDDDTPRPSMVAVETRPLTSIAHELGHQIGRAHAGQGCPKTGPSDKQAGEQWLPDDKGILQGIGLDLWGIAKAPTGFTPTAAAPYRVIARDLRGSAAEFYDLMSYCGATVETASATSFPNTWLSPRGWNAEVATLEQWTQKTGGTIGIAHAARARAAAAAAAAPVLAVTAVGRDVGAAILRVAPGTGTPTPASAGGRVLVGYDAAGAEVARAGLRDELLADDGLHLLTGSVPAARVVRVAILDPAGAVLSHRTRSPHAPHVAVTAPRAGATVGGTRAVRVAWKAGDADGGALAATVEASTDDGRTWRRIAQGAATSATLPASYFAASTQARVRVTVDDGFRSVAAVSRRFRALRAPASVHIDTPRTGAKVASDGALTLSGSASTLQGRVASGRLVWRLDGRAIARGARASVRDLPPGRRVLTLGVRADAKAVARVVVTIRAVTPPFLRVTIPSHVSAKARSVLVRLRSGAATTVRGGGRSVKIKARGRATLRLSVRRGHAAAWITLTARALGNDYSFTRVVRRSR